MITVADLQMQILLRGLDKEEYKKLLRRLVYEKYQKNEIIFNEGDPPRGIYLIKKGRVKISKLVNRSHSKTLVIFKDGNFFGDISALENRPHSATAVALTDTEIFLLGIQELGCGNIEDLFTSCRIIKKLAIIASKNLRHMNVKYFKLEESF